MYVCVLSIRLNRPPVPRRIDSLVHANIPEGTMESLVGRVKYDGPVCVRVKNDHPNTTLPDGYCDRLFQQEDDTYSMQSYASSIAPSVAPMEYDNDTVISSVPSATITTAEGVNFSLSQESNGSVLSSSSSESSKDQPTTGEIQRKASSLQRKNIMKRKYRSKPSTIDTLTDGIGFRRSLSPRDVIKEDEVLDLSQENDIMPTEMPQPLSPVHVSLSYYNFTYLHLSYLQKTMDNRKYALRRLVNKKSSASTSRMYAAVQV